MKVCLFVVSVFVCGATGFARTATTEKKIEAESQVHGTRGDPGEKALQQQEDLEVDPQKPQRPPKYDSDIIKEKYPEDSLN